MYVNLCVELHNLGGMGFQSSSNILRADIGFFMLSGAAFLHNFIIIYEKHSLHFLLLYCDEHVNLIYL